MENLKSQVKFMNEMEAKEVVEEVLEQSQKIVKDAEEEAARVRDRKMKEIQEIFKEKEMSQLESAKLEQKRKLSALRTELLDQAIAEAKAKLERTTSEESSRYQKALAKLVVEAAEAVSTADMEVLGNSRDHEFLEKELPELRKKLQKGKGKVPVLRLSGEKLTCLGGIIVQDKDKKRIFNNTVEARLTKTKQELENKLFKDVFEGEEN